MLQQESRCKPDLLLFVVIFSLSQPYEATYLNNLERSALSINVITLLCGLGLFTNDSIGEDAKSPGLALFLTLSIVGLNAMFVLNVGWVFFQRSMYCTVCQRWRRKESGVVVVPQVSHERSDAHLYAILKMQNQIRSSVLMQKANATKANANGIGSRGRLKRKDTAAVVNLVVKNASEQAQLKIKQLENRKKISLSRLKNRLEQRKSRVHVALPATEPRVARPKPADVSAAASPPPPSHGGKKSIKI